MRSVLHSGLAVCGLALASTAAMAQQPRWYVEPESFGSCGDECYAPPTAWVYTANGQFALGVQCDGVMVLAGPAMAQSTSPIATMDMVVDGRPYGAFVVESGLNDYYVSPTLGGAQDWWGVVRPALASGSALQMRLGPSALLEFGLGGSRAALDSVDAQCAARGTGEGSADTQPRPAPAPAGSWAGRSWEAYSSISMAITGNITTTPTEIIFNGARMPVRVVQENVQGLWGVGSEVGLATILQVTPPTNPVLLEGNTLCGVQPTYISLYVEPQGGLAMTVYRGAGVPQNSQSDDVCAMYFYGAL